MSVDLNALAVFQRVADCRSFTAAAQQLGVTRSAVSQTLTKLEQSLGVALLLRTTRSVSLTDAGQALLVSVSPALAELGNALEASVRRQAAVSGQLRLAVSSIAEAFLAGPLLATFAARYPALQLDITVTDEALDIVGAGFDAGVRLGRSLRRTWSRSRCRRGSASWWCARRTIAMRTCCRPIHVNWARIAASAGAARPAERPIAGNSRSAAGNSVLMCSLKSPATTWA